MGRLSFQQNKHKSLLPYWEIQETGKLRVRDKEAWCDSCPRSGPGEGLQIIQAGGSWAVNLACPSCLTGSRRAGTAWLLSSKKPGSISENLHTCLSGREEPDRPPACRRTLHFDVSEGLKAYLFVVGITMF